MGKSSKNERTFIFDSYSISPQNREFSFRYRLISVDEELDFEEKLIFPRDFDLDKIDRVALERSLEGVHLALGISYWKAYCPKDIRLPDYVLAKKEALFWDRVYKKGLGEFFYKNKIDYRDLIKFPYSSKTNKFETKKGGSKKSGKSLLLFGGGKDSWVSYELLKKSKKDVDLFSIVSSSSGALAKYLPEGAIVVERKIDPRLFEINKRRDVYNGHVPISALIAFVSNLTALVYGYGYVIASNERSANYGNVKYLGEEINHQWSKSFEFEKAFREYWEGDYNNPVYFSLLRPFYELKIVEMFSNYPKYFPGFTSCNANFKILEGRVKFAWCNLCPKCAFVFSMMSAFLPRAEVIKIFGEDLFAKKELLGTFRELLGLKKIKPFECVGTPEEVHMAFFAAYESGEYFGEPAMKMFEREALGKIKNIEKLYKELMSVSKKHLIPEVFVSILKKQNQISLRDRSGPLRAKS